MIARIPTSTAFLVGGQICGIVLAFALLAAWPPARGDLLLVPIGVDSGSGLAASAIAHGARLVAQGPFPGSLVVSGQRARLTAPMLRAGVLILTGSAALCGQRNQEATA